MKTYAVTITCRQLPSAHAEYFYRVKAGCWHVAVSRALRLFEREPRVRRRKLVGLEIHAVAITTVQREATRQAGRMSERGAELLRQAIAES